MSFGIVRLEGGGEKSTTPVSHFWKLVLFICYFAGHTFDLPKCWESIIVEGGKQTTLKVFRTNYAKFCQLWQIRHVFHPSMVFGQPFY